MMQFDGCESNSEAQREKVFINIIFFSVFVHVLITLYLLMGFKARCPKGRFHRQNITPT